MPCDLIQGQGHGNLKWAKIADFKDYLLYKKACNQKTITVNYEYDTPNSLSIVLDIVLVQDNI